MFGRRIPIWCLGITFLSTACACTSPKTESPPEASGEHQLVPLG
jgi:hypothetical protein